MIVRTNEEYAALCEGGRRLANILRQLKAKVIPGVSTLDIEDEAKRLIAAHGDMPAFLGYTPSGSARPYPAAACVSINEEIVHGIPNEKPKIFRDGDVVSVDVGIIHQGLVTDAAVVAVAGKGSKEDHKLVRAVEEALREAILMVRAGGHVGDIGNAVERVAKKYGLGIPRELGGHGVGRSVHEEPFIPNWGRRGTGELLEKGMVLAIEPMFALGSGDVELAGDGYTYVTKDGSKTAQIEHTVLVTEKQAEILTK